MGRNLYILAATLFALSLVCFVLAYTGVARDPGSPGDVALWRTSGLGLLVVSIFVAIAGVLSALFEQAERRADEDRRRRRQR